MWGNNSRTGARSARRMALCVEGLDIKTLPGAVGPPLGPYLAAATSLPKVTSQQTIVEPHFAVNAFLSTQLGSAVDGVQQQAELQGASENNLVANQVVSQPFIHAVLSKQDTYTLLDSALSATGGALSGVYSATGPILANALLTGSSHAGPNAPRRIPGLGLVNALAHNHNFPNAHLGTWLYALHNAVDRQVFSLSDAQQNLVSQGLQPVPERGIRARPGRHVQSAGPAAGGAATQGPALRHALRLARGCAGAGKRQPGAVRSPVARRRQFRGSDRRRICSRSRRQLRHRPDRSWPADRRTPGCDLGQ